MTTKRTVAAPAIDAEDCQRWLAAKAKRAAAAAEMDAIGKRLKAAMGEMTVYAIGPFTIQKKAEPYRAFDQAGFKADHPKLVADYTVDKTKNLFDIVLDQAAAIDALTKD